MVIERITIDPKVCHGQACIRGTRIPVYIILDLLRAGETEENILSAYPHITREDIQACLAYAAALAREKEKAVMSTRTETPLLMELSSDELQLHLAEIADECGGAGGINSERNITTG